MGTGKRRAVPDGMAILEAPDPAHGGRRMFYPVRLYAESGGYLRVSYWPAIRPQLTLSLFRRFATRGDAVAFLWRQAALDTHAYSSHAGGQ